MFLTSLWCTAALQGGTALAVAGAEGGGRDDPTLER